MGGGRKDQFMLALFMVVGKRGEGGGRVLRTHNNGVCHPFGEKKRGRG